MASMPASLFALVLTADPASGALEPELIERTGELLNGRGGGRWLQSGAAFEWVFAASASDPVTLRTTMTAHLHGLPIDVNVVPADPAGRIKRLLVADMDSTLIQQEMIDELAELAGRRDEIAAITLKAMQGEMEFTTSLLQRVSLLAGLPTDDLARAGLRFSLTPGARALMAGMTAEGARTALISSGFMDFTAQVATMLDLKTHHGNVLELEHGCLTGRIRPPVLNARTKRDILLDLAADADLELSHVVAVGDGANDLPMLEAAGLAVAFRAKRIVREAMAARMGGAVIDHGDLTALLHLQGLTSPANETMSVTSPS